MQPRSSLAPHPDDGQVNLDNRRMKIYKAIIKGWWTKREEKVNKYFGKFSSVQFSHSVMSDSVTPWIAACLPVHHQLLEFTQTHVHWVGDAIQPSHPVIPFASRLQSFPAWGSFQMSQLFASGGQSIGASASTSVLPMNTQESVDSLKRVSSLYQVAKVLQFQLQHQSFQRIFRTDIL